MKQDCRGFDVGDASDVEGIGVHSPEHSQEVMEEYTDEESRSARANQ